MKHRFLQLLVSALSVAAIPVAALAASADEPTIVNARLAGYSGVEAKGSVALTWILLIFLTLVCVAALFKNSRRTHLD